MFVNNKMTNKRGSTFPLTRGKVLFIEQANIASEIHHDLTDDAKRQYINKSLCNNLGLSLN